LLCFALLLQFESAFRNFFKTPPNLKFIVWCLCVYNIHCFALLLQFESAFRNFF
jgi:hypothetical protein